ncbi:amidohydrolase family protein, partial [bacterium]|nr:amidohydrolase family protein [bacterium]
VMRHGTDPGATVFNPLQKLTIQETLRIHTMGSAYASFSEDSTGSLEPGKYADLVIWSHDLYTMDPSESILLEAEMTIVNGEIVYDDGSNPITFVPSDNIDQNIPKSFQLSQNYPHPFNPMTVIRFGLKEPCHVLLNVYDLRGRIVSEIIDAKYQPGEYEVLFDATGLASGIYFYRIETEHFGAVRKMVLLD